MKQSKTFVSYLIKDKAQFTDMYNTLAECCDNPLVDYPTEGVVRQTFFRDRKLVFKTYKYAHDLYIHDYRDGHEAKYHYEVKAQSFASHHTFLFINYFKMPETNMNYR